MNHQAAALSITHTHAEGTLIEGTARGDGTAPILKTNGWRWGRSIAAWYVPRSRDQRPNRRVIEATAAALTAAGFDVEQDLDESTRSAAQVEADKIERQQERAEAMSAKADRKHAAADQARDRADRYAATLPPDGQPILVGHHSEARHRRALEKTRNSAFRALEVAEDAREADRRAQAAAATTASRYSPVTVANRIDRISADIRRIERQIGGDVLTDNDGYQPASPELKERRLKRYTPRLEELRDQLGYWQGIRDAQIADGQATNYGPHNVAAGDQVKIRGYWYTVERANAKTVSVPSGYSWTNRSPWHEVQDHRARSQGTA